ncbi:MAG: ATP-binding protein [Acetatifactor sp.]
MGIQTQICGLILLLTVMVLKVLQPQVQVRTRHMYTALLASGIICLYLDAYSLLVLMNAAGEYGFYVRAVCKLYLISLDVMCCLSFLYLSTDLTTHKKLICIVRRGCCVWGSLMGVAICFLPIYVNDETEQIFTYGSSVYATYLVAATTLIGNFVVMLSHRKDMERRKWLAGMMWVIIWIIATVIQLTHADILLIGFAAAVGITIVFIQLETPDYQKLNETMRQLEISRKEASEANEAKSSFLAQMSHEIRTPINAVLGMNEMILRESKEDNILEYAANAYNSGKALLSLVNDVLDISKIEAGKLEIVEAEYGLHSLVNDCYRMVEDRARKKNLQFNYSVEESMPSRLIGDMFHVRQVVVNFLTNAVKYTEEGSVELAFSGKPLEEGYLLQVSVKDTGIGLTPESMEKLFTSFQRFDLKRNQSVEGTGLGLSICKQLSELMGGTVYVESEYGKGSIFSCEVPQKIASDVPVGRVVIDCSAEHRNLQSGKKFTAPGVRLLVVDDIEMNLLVFSGLLKEHRFQVDKADSGRKCLDLIQKHKYDVIFMDHMMPDMDGMETFARMCHMEHQNQDTPVIMLTANAVSGEKEKYLSAGFSGYLTKPIQSEKLEEILLKYLPEDRIIWEDEVPSSSTDLKKGFGSLEGATEGAKGALEGSAQSAGEECALFDRKLGLRYAGGNEEIYNQILVSYVKNGFKKISQIGELYEQEAWKNYVTEVHALKSTSLSIGAKRLSEAAAELEKAGKTGNYALIKEKNNNLLVLYREVLEVCEKETGCPDGRNGNITGLAKENVSAGEAVMGVGEESAKVSVHEAVKRTGEESVKVTVGETGKEIVEGTDKKILEEIDIEVLKGYAERLKRAARSFDDGEIMSLCDELAGYSYQGKELGALFSGVREAADDFESEQAGEEAERIFEDLL